MEFGPLYRSDVRLRRGMKFPRCQASDTREIISTRHFHHRRDIQPRRTILWDDWRALGCVVNLELVRITADPKMSNSVGPTGPQIKHIGLQTIMHIKEL